MTEITGTDTFGGNVRGVRGALLKWAREQQGLTMRWVRDHGGPSAGYQCEVENGDKTEVRASTLAAWVRILGVTDAYARGEVPQYLRDSERCKGMAAALVDRVRHDPLMWREMKPDERVIRVLQLVTERLPHLPRVVLAHVMSLELPTLDAIMVGSHPVMRMHVKTLSVLTTLPESFFDHGELVSPALLPDEWLTAISEAQRAGVSVAELREWIRRHRR